IHLVNDSRLFVAARPAHVPSVVVRQLRGLSASEVKGVEVEMSIAVRVEIDRVGDPHRVAARPDVVGYSASVVVFQIKNIELVGLSAAVALLGAEVARSRRVDDLRSVGGKVSGSGLRHRERLGRAAVYRNAV